MRKSSVDEVVEWWSGPTKKLGEHTTMVLCGGACEVYPAQVEGGKMLIAL